ncbi:hypothetical protein [Devosia rhizoryzae]|nr:hypothetical protein [Devosia rhizoryzae]
MIKDYQVSSVLKGVVFRADPAWEKIFSWPPTICAKLGMLFRKASE